MIDFNRAQLTHFAIHQVGNKGLGEELTTSEKVFEFRNDFVKETVLKYFLSPFKTDIYYQFKGRFDISLDSVSNICEDLFNSRKSFIKDSKKLAKHLFNQSMHPKTPGGTFYVCYFKDMVCDGELADVVGLFKTEKRETYLKLNQKIDEFDFDTDNGININKLDKGCLIFNTNKKTGYKISVIDSNNKVAECALYWSEDFLNSKLLPNGFYHTQNLINTTRAFVEEKLVEEEVPVNERNALLSKSLKYITEQDKFILQDFEREILKKKELINQFTDYRNDYLKRLDITKEDSFDVSKTAIKKNQKYLRTVIKLDTNFHIYIHANHEEMEEGYDEDKGKKYYKLFYVNKE